ncbi:MAG TPA: ceramide glucosyltransferase, partial [Thermodesulfobacteriota bacterium]|nr:ceramide glucosyltransferase [Thermodesulfobacteriota bacterium]
MYGLLCLRAVRRFARGKPITRAFFPPVSILKPVCGTEKEQEANLRSACLQDYPEYEVIFCVQDANDPALPLLDRIAGEFPERACVARENLSAG